MLFLDFATLLCVREVRKHFCVKLFTKELKSASNEIIKKPTCGSTPNAGAEMIAVTKKFKTKATIAAVIGSLGLLWNGFNLY